MRFPAVASLWLLAGLLGLALPTQATIRYVDSVIGENHFSTINGAYDAAVEDDTLLIAAGQYAESVTFSKGLVVIGSGYDYDNRTRINGKFTVTGGVDEFSIFGCFIYSDGASFDFFNVGNVVISRCFLYQYTSGSGIHPSVYFSANYSINALIESSIIRVRPGHYTNEQSAIYSIADNLTVINCLITADSYGYSTVISGTPQTFTLMNSVFLDQSGGIFSTTGSFSCVVINCIAYDWGGASSWGSFPGSSTFDYNASSSVLPPGENAILLDVTPFVNYDLSANFFFGVSDLSLDEFGGANCIDAGSPAILDLDGSPSDLGIYGGPTPFVDNGVANYPYVVNMTVPGAISVGDPLPISAVGRIGRE